MPQPTGPTRFSWNANSEPDLQGYRLYEGRASGSYTVPGSPTDVGNVLTTLYNVTLTGAWFFALVAHNATGQISGFSSEITDSFVQATRPVSAFASGG